MFRRKDTALPKDPTFPAKLDELGYELNPEGQFVKTAGRHGDKAGEFFTFYISDNERSNEMQREAMHECARNVVLEELKNMGVQQLHLGGEDGATVSTERPERKHITILASDPKKLKTKKHVWVVIGEHTQDLGIWTFRSLMRQGGINEGSAVGLVKKLEDNDNPGILILNPGQLVWSNSEKKSMTQKTWHARPKPSAIADDVPIHRKLNIVPGHSSPEEHIATVFDRVIPKLIGDDTRLFLVGITDGAENTINYLDKKHCEGSKTEISGRVEAMAWMSPHIRPEEIQSETLKNFMKTDAVKSWIISSKPKDQFIAAADGTSQIRLGSEAQKHRADESKNAFDGIPSSNQKISEIGKKNENEMLSPEAQATATKKNASLAPINIPVAEGASKNITNDSPIVGSPPVDISKSLQSNKDVIFSQSNTCGASNSPLASITNLQLDETDRIADSVSALGSSLSHDATWEKEIHQEFTEDSYDYDAYPVPYATFSAGLEDMLEMIFPNIVGSVLEHFLHQVEKADDHDARAPAAAAADK